MAETPKVLGKIEPRKEDQTTIVTRPSSNSRSAIIFGMVVVLTIFLGFGGWAALAPLARAVSAYAILAVKSDRKQIQHFEGGIVGALHVNEGELVKKDQLLVALNPLQASATVARHDAQLDQALARRARLESELNGTRDISLEGQLLDRLAESPPTFEIVQAEERHLLARLDTVDGTIAILSQRIEQLNDEISGLKIQRKSRLAQLEIFKTEILG